MERDPKHRNAICLKLQDAPFALKEHWLMNEWTVDEDHGVWVYQMYADFEKAGLKPAPSAPVYDGNPKERFGSGWRMVFDRNRPEYERIVQSTLTEKEKQVHPENGAIQLDYEMPAHSVKLIELVPAKQAGLIR